MFLAVIKGGLTCNQVYRDKSRYVKAFSQRKTLRVSREFGIENKLVTNYVQEMLFLI